MAKRLDNDPLKNAPKLSDGNYWGKYPDPWAMVPKLDYQADGNYASTVRSQVMYADVSEHPKLEKKLLAILDKSNCTYDAIDFVCRLLSTMGSAASIPALTKLLARNKTAHMARYALQNLPDPAVDPVLRGALGSLSGPALAGLIGSIGLRGDKAALGAIKKIAADANAESDVKEMAQRAIARLQGK